MTLEVLGAGFGRTATMSLKLALERLGFAPCYHMAEIERRREHADVWLRAARGQGPDWRDLFAGYAAAVDWPVATFWRQILAAHDDAKIVLTVRDAAEWYDSFRETIVAKALGPAPPGSLPVKPLYDLSRTVILEGTFGGRALDRAHAIAVYERHNADVVAALEPERLLVFDPADGWEPLSRFLGRPVPDEPFPHANRRSSFLSRYKAPRRSLTVR
jgi:Sulfotransferase domain